MKILLVIAVASISFVFGLFHYRDLPGCEKSKLPPNTLIENCCPTLPHYKNRELFVQCNQTCAVWLTNLEAEGARKCCLLNCTYVYEEIMEKYGPFKPQKMIEKMTINLTAANKHWKETIKSVVNECHKKGNDLDIVEIQDMDIQCETDNITLALNITHCIRREMFFACKDAPMTSNERCKSLVNFGKGCNYWPWQCNFKRAHKGDMQVTRRPPGTK